MCLMVDRERTPRAMLVDVTVEVVWRSGRGFAGPSEAAVNQGLKSVFIRLGKVAPTRAAA